MIKNSAWAWNWKTMSESLFQFSPFLLVTIVFALLLSVVLGIFNSAIGGAIAGSLLFVVVIALRQDQLAAVLVVAAHLYLDWYLGLRIMALVLVLVLLFVFFLFRSPQRPWVGPRAFWLWILLLALAIFPATRGVTWNDGIEYYLNDFFAPLIIVWLGAVIARNILTLRYVLQLLAALGTLLAIHTIIQATTGTLLFGTTHYDALLAQVSNYQLAGTGVHRIGSFFLDPNWNGAFMAMMFFIPLGLFFESQSIRTKVLYFVEMCLIISALLYIFSNGAWVGVFAGLVAFILLAGQIRYRFQILSIILVAAVVIGYVFPAQVGLELQHATGSTEVVSRLSAWQTGVNVIRAFPLTGIGLGLLSYLARAEPYRVIAQYVPLAHPHNAYLEIAAMAGLPVLALFLTLLLLIFCLALRNWFLADSQTRSLVGGGIAAIVALSVNSISINGWTLAPLAMTGWLILGAVASPLLTRTFKSLKTLNKDKNVTSVALN